MCILFFSLCIFYNSIIYSWPVRYPLITIFLLYNCPPSHPTHKPWVNTCLFHLLRFSLLFSFVFISSHLQTPLLKGNLLYSYNTSVTFFFLGSIPFRAFHPCVWIWDTLSSHPEIAFAFLLCWILCFFLSWPISSF